jgi:hypothetical protein
MPDLEEMEVRVSGTIGGTVDAVLMLNGLPFSINQEMAFVLAASVQCAAYGAGFGMGMGKEQIEQAEDRIRDEVWQRVKGIADEDRLDGRLL